MNQACVHNDTIDVGNHHGRPQCRPFLQFLTTQERNVIWLLLAIAFLPVDGTTLGLGKILQGRRKDNLLPPWIPRIHRRCGSRDRKI